MLIELQKGQGVFNDDTITFGSAEFHEPEVFHDKDGNLFIRHFSISEGYNTQGWRVRDVERYIRTGMNMPTIITPGFHHIIGLNKEQLMNDMKPYTIGYAIDFMKNEKYGCWDAITKVTDQEAEKAIDAGYIPRFMSPLVHASKWHVENIDGIQTKIFDEWELLQHAVVQKPGFRPIEMATIREYGCKGTDAICRNKLAAIAEDISTGELLKNYFDAYISGEKKEVVMGDNDKDNPANQLIQKLRDDLSAKEKELTLNTEKYSTLEIKAKQDSEKLVNVSAELDNVKKEIDAFKKEKELSVKKQTFDEKLKRTKMFHNDNEARGKKVEELVNKNITVEDLDSIYEGMFYSEEQLKELSATPQPPATGIAEHVETSLNTGNGNSRHVEGARILKEILEL